MGRGSVQGRGGGLAAFLIIVTVVVDVWYKSYADKKATQAARKKAMQRKEGEA